MTWTCDQTEARLSDYLDGLLPAQEAAAFDEHLHACPQCGPFVASIRGLVSNLHEMEEVELPPQFVYKVLDKTLGPRESVTGWQAILAAFRGFLSPKFAYGAMSIVATFFLLLSASGFSFRKPKLADLYPANVYRNADRQVHQLRARGERYVSELRVVYEIQSRLRTEDNNPALTTPEESRPKNGTEKEPGQTDDQKPSQPRQQNRANEVIREVETLAAECPVLLNRGVR